MRNDNKEQKGSWRRKWRSTLRGVRIEQAVSTEASLVLVWVAFLRLPPRRSTIVEQSPSGRRERFAA